MAKVKASDVAAELRRLAEAMERAVATTAGTAVADLEIPQPVVIIQCGTKEEFQAVARALPRPLTKRVEAVLSNYHKIRLDCPFAAIKAYASIDRAKVCRQIEPAREAVWECEPILTEEELDEALVEKVAEVVTAEPATDPDLVAATEATEATEQAAVAEAVAQTVEAVQEAPAAG